MKYLLSISIGPVQPFIEAARRTADLYAGSHLLVDIAKEVAASIKRQGGDLIFPADPSTDGPNKILAIVEGDPKDAAEHARTAADGKLQEAWDEALGQVQGAWIDMKLAEAQIDSFLEFYAAWVPLDDNYAAARTRVERLLAGRKALRDFRQPLSKPGVPKSPLDPSRDTILQRNVPRQTPPLNLKPAEHLDAVSLIKRVRGAKSRSVPSTTRLAAAALVAQLKKERPDELQALKEKAKEIDQGMEFEDLLHPGRRQDLLEAGEISEGEAQEAARLAIDALGRPEPPDWASYYAVLVADGDHMGRLLNDAAKGGPEAHRKLSQALSDFGQKARGIVEQNEGQLVYSGGDDVLALLPAHTALDCASQLAQQFQTATKEWPSNGAGTLSVGVAIVHHLDAFRISLDRARDAERKAKTVRNALCIALHTRGGEPRSVVEQWSAFSLDTWKQWIAAFQGSGGLSHGFPYELSHLAREAGSVVSPETLVAEALRILHRKKGGNGSGGSTFQYLGSLQQAIQAASKQEELEKLVAKLIICRFLAQYGAQEEKP